MKLLPWAPVSSRPRSNRIGSVSVMMIPERINGWQSVCEGVEVADASWLNSASVITSSGSEIFACCRSGGEAR